MRKPHLLALAAIAVGCSSVADPVEETGAESSSASDPVQVAQIGRFTEGIVIDHAGDFYVSHEDQISKVTASGEVTPWANTPSPNGHKILADGTHVICDRETGVFLLSSEGEVIRIIESPSGANDVVLDRDHGGFYFSSPYGSQENPEVGKVYHVNSAGEAAIAASGIHYPNGIILRPDGQALIVGESFANRLLEFPVEAPGRLGEPRVFAEMPEAEDVDPSVPDGMAFDTDGNLYVANYGPGAVRVFNTAGELVRSIPTGAMFTSNVAFAGPEMNQLYVVGSLGPVQQSTGVLMRVDLSGVTGVQVLPDAE